MSVNYHYKLSQEDVVFCKETGIAFGLAPAHQELWLGCENCQFCTMKKVALYPDVHQLQGIIQMGIDELKRMGCTHIEIIKKRAPKVLDDLTINLRKQ